MVRYAPTAPASLKILIEGSEVHNVGRANSGNVVRIDCTGAGGFCTAPNSEIRSVYGLNVGSMLYSHGAGAMLVDNNWLIRNINSSTVATPFIDIEGGTSSSDSTCNSAIYIDGNTVIGGSLSLINGCAQGLRWRDNNLSSCYEGIYQTNPYHVEALQIIHNYIEGYVGGIIPPQSGFDQIEQNSFDKGSIGSYSSWSGIVVGTAHTANPGENIDHNNIFGFNAAATGVPMVLNVGGGAEVDDNIIDGVIVPTGGVCMAVGTDDSGDGNKITPPLTVTGNSAWVCGSITAIGTGPFIARGNEYNLPSGAVAKFEQN